MNDSNVVLQKDFARNGEAIFKMNGRSVVSSFDPWKEAHTWAKAAIGELGTQKSVVLIGAGCGYHIQALKILKPSLSILTIEQSSEVKDAVLEIHPSLKTEDILVAPSVVDLSESLRLRDFISGRFTVLSHPVQAHMRPDWTQDIAGFLKARDPFSFLLQLRMRPELHALFDEEAILKLANNRDPISILTIRGLFKPEAKTARERRIWRVLEELIV